MTVLRDAAIASVGEKEATKDNTWSKHAWTFFDNPYIPLKSKMPHQAALQRELERRGVTPEDPTIQREWFGRWTFDAESLLLRLFRDLDMP